MLDSRWKKVIRDVKVNKIRSLLVILSIVMGLTGIGVIGQSNYIVKKGMQDSYAEIHPSNGTIFTDFFSPDFLKKVKAVKGVKEVQGKTVLPAKIKTKGWKSLSLFAMDYSHIPMDQLYFKKSKPSKKTNELFIEETTLKNEGLKIGNSVRVMTPNGQSQKMTIAGAVKDLGKETAFVSKVGYGYISNQTLQTFGYPNKMNALSFTVTGDQRNLQKSIDTAAHLKTLFQKEKLPIQSTYIPLKMQHWAYDIVHSMNIILQELGLFILAAGVGLIATTILTIITSQTKQIGILQSIGATPKQVFTLYFVMVLTYSLIALVLAIPLSMLGARLSTHYSNNLLNFDSTHIGFSYQVVLFQMIVGIGIPCLAALIPIIKASNISIVAALNFAGGLQSRFVWMFRNTRFLPVLLLLSIRNTFRKKSRLLITILTLLTGGTALLSVFTIYSSMGETEQRSLQFTNFDAQLLLNQPIDSKKLFSITRQNHSIRKAEVWNQVIGNRIRPNQSSSRDLKIMIPTLPTHFIKPVIIKGRWLKPDDRNVMVLDSYSLTEESDVHVGDSIVISINGIKKKVKVIGFARKVSGEVVSYADSHLLDSANQSNLLCIKTTSHTKSNLAKIIKSLEAQRISIASTQFTSDLKSQQETRFSIVLVFLIGMAILMILVTMIGLMGTITLNTMERTIEIGILRSMGAANRTIAGLIIGEGLWLGILGWAAASLLSYPISKMLTNEIGKALFNTPLDFRFSISGIWLWLGISLLISVFACLIPAWKAVKLSIKDVLAYE